MSRPGLFIATCYLFMSDLYDTICMFLANNLRNVINGTLITVHFNKKCIIINIKLQTQFTSQPFQLVNLYAIKNENSM